MKKLIFDVDGTILESMHIWIEPQNELFEKYNFRLEDLAPEEKGFIEALAFEDMCKYIAEEIATDMTYEQVVKHFVDTVEDGYRNHLMPKEGAIEFLKDLKDKGYNMSVASSTPFSYLEMALKRLGIFDYFDFFATPDLLGCKKSDQEFWKYSVEKHGVSPSECILFDDALYAIKAAKTLGIKTIGLKDFPWNEKEWNLIVKEADLVLDGLAQASDDDLK